MFKILVLEDETELARSVCSYLNRKGYQATACPDAKSAYNELYSGVYDLIISDIMLPGIDGYEFAATIRENNSEIPIIFMTARDDFYSMQKGFHVGIDDYMVKPINLEELVLRIEALMRRAKIASSKKLAVGEFEMNMDERSARLAGTELSFTAREFNILYKLLSYPGKTFTRAQLMDEFWGCETSSGPRTVDVYMAKIRDKLTNCPSIEILTIHGLGYKAVIK